MAKIINNPKKIVEDTLIIRTRKKSGFSLMELIVVIAIIALMAAIGIPNFINWLPKRRLSGATRMVFGDLSSARMKAVNLNRRVKVFFDDHQYRICDDANNSGGVDDGEGDNVVKDIQNNHADVTFDLGSTADPVFNPRGTATNRTITLQNDSGSKSITISIAGRIKIN